MRSLQPTGYLLGRPIQPELPRHCLLERRRLRHCGGVGEPECLSPWVAAPCPGKIIGPLYGVGLDEDVAAITKMDQVFTLSGTKHIALRHRVVRLRLDLIAVWHRVLHWPIFNNENATIAECCTTSDAHGQRRLWVKFGSRRS